MISKSDKTLSNKETWINLSGKNVLTELIKKKGHTTWTLNIKNTSYLPYIIISLKFTWYFFHVVRGKHFDSRDFSIFPFNQKYFWTPNLPDSISDRNIVSDQPRVLHHNKFFIHIIYILLISGSEVTKGIYNMNQRYVSKRLIGVGNLDIFFFKYMLLPFSARLS